MLLGTIRETRHSQPGPLRARRRGAAPRAQTNKGAKAEKLVSENQTHVYGLLAGTQYIFKIHNVYFEYILGAHFCFFQLYLIHM